MLRLLLILISLAIIAIDYLVINKLHNDQIAHLERIKLLEHEMHKCMVKEIIYESN